MNFSALISVYAKEDPSYLELSLSSLENQTLMPSEIVIVKDGSLTPELDLVISDCRKESDIPYKIVNIVHNIGLGRALNHGIKYCSYEWIARMDSDDIAVSDRFEKQIEYLEKYKNVSVLGGSICEFDRDFWECTKERKTPQRHKDILRYSKYRNPINHMTVMFKKEDALSVGGYLPLEGFEDYYLWIRMLQYRFVFANLDDVLVKVRAGDSMLKRRRGWRYMRNEWLFEKSARREGFLTRYEMYRNIFIRTVARLMPSFILKRVYRSLRR
jgi:glycosyltransferase involved in cell wall biosynthesis